VTGADVIENAVDDGPLSIRAVDVRPGMIVWNPQGGRRGRMEVSGEVRQLPDGTVQFDLADGRTGHFTTSFPLRLDRAAMARAAQAGSEPEPAAAQCRPGDGMAAQRDRQERGAEGSGTPPAGVLVSSSLPLANEALAAGHAARVALARHADLQAAYERRCARPLPAGGRQRRWATENRARHERERDEAGREAAELAERWARLMGQLEQADPARAEAVGAAVRRASPRADGRPDL
jgi:hypothetical protein